MEDQGFDVSIPTVVYVDIVSSYSREKSLRLGEVYLTGEVDESLGLEFCDIPNDFAPGYKFKIVDKRRFLLASLKYGITTSK